MKWKKLLFVGVLVIAMVMFTFPAAISAAEEVEDLQLTAVCSDDPDETRCWEIYNPNHFDVEFKWKYLRETHGSSTWSGNQNVPAMSSVIRCVSPDIHGHKGSWVRIQWKDSSGATQLSAKVDTIDDICEGDVTILKYSGDKRLSGAVFDVTDGQGFSVQVTTGADGIATVKGAPDGIIYVKEVVAPEGCEIDPNQYTVEVINGKGEIHLENDCPPPPTKKTEEPPAEEPAEEIEVLAFTGQSPMFFIFGFGLIAIAGGLIVGLRLRKVRQ